eukprot:g14126.t1
MLKRLQPKQSARHADPCRVSSKRLRNSQRRQLRWPVRWISLPKRSDYLPQLHKAFFNRAWKQYDCGNIVVRLAPHFPVRVLLRSRTTKVITKASWSRSCFAPERLRRGRFS